MLLADLDYLAVHGRSVLHKASPNGKIAFALMAVTAILLTSRVERLAIIFAFLVVSLVASGLSLRMTSHVLTAPALFAIVFALAVTNGTSLTRYAIALRALGTAATMLLLISTTSIFDLTACMGRVLSPLVADVVFMTCRSVFLLSDRLSNTFVAVRLKGGATPRRAIANLTSLGGALGAALLSTLDLSERMRRILALRGYSPGAMLPSLRQATWWDIVPLAAGAAALGVALW